MPMHQDIPQPIQGRLGRVICSCKTAEHLDNTREWIYRLSKQKQYNPVHVDHFIWLVDQRLKHLVHGGLGV